MRKRHMVIAFCAITTFLLVIAFLPRVRFGLNTVLHAILSYRGCEFVTYRDYGRPIRYWYCDPQRQIDQKQGVSRFEEELSPVPKVVNRKVNSVILLHGAGADAASTWFRVLPQLGRAYRVYAPQFAYGVLAQSAADFENFFWEQSLLLDIIDGEKLERPVLIGLSAGAWVAALFAATFPDRVGGLVLVSPMGAQNTKVIESFLDENAAGKVFVQRLFHDPPPLLGLLENVLGDEVDVAIRALRENYSPELVRGMSLEARGANIKCPVLVVWGQEDKIIPRSAVERLRHSIAGSKLRVVPGAGHAMVWDRPDELERLLLNFLEGL